MGIPSITGTNAPTSPIIMPSMMNGQRINQSVAPTYFMILISTLRFTTEIRIVFIIIMTDIMPSTSITSTLAMRNTLFAFISTSVSVCPWRMLSMPSIRSRASSTLVWLSMPSSEIWKEWESGLFVSSSPTKISSSAPHSFLRLSSASPGEIYSTFSTCSTLLIWFFIFSISSPVSSPFKKTEIPIESSIWFSIYCKLEPTQ